MATNEELKALLARWIGTYGVYRRGFGGPWCCDNCGAFSYEGRDAIEHIDDCMIAATQRVLAEKETSTAAGVGQLEEQLTK